jgi:hypothetical protein
MGNESDYTKNLAHLIDHVIRVLLMCRGLVGEGWKSLDLGGTKALGVSGTPELVAQEPGKPDETQAQEDANIPLRGILTDMRIREITEAGFLTNDIVQLTGGFGKEDTRQMKINGQPAIKLDRREFAVMLVLAKHAVSTRVSPDDRPQRVYLPVKQILAEVDKLNKAPKESATDFWFWRYPSADDVRRCISRLRKRIHEVGGNERLIESAPQRGGGYRLSTAWWNVIAILSENGRSQDFWHEAHTGAAGT